MNTLHRGNGIRLYEKRTPLGHTEQEVARRWWNLPPSCLLPTSNGISYQLIYGGHRGGPVGPDVHDAVLLIPATNTRIVGDIEFHTNASAWTAHQHHLDARYNQVILHVVLFCDDPHPTMSQNGSTIPLCSLNDLAPLPTHERLLTDASTRWPCQKHLAQMSAEEQYRLLQRAGLLRFEQKTHAFVEQLHTAPMADHYDRSLLLALAEALGYGRDRELFRAIGAFLLMDTTRLPEPLGKSMEPSALDTHRLQVLRAIVTLWQDMGTPSLWQRFADALCLPESRQAWHELRAFFLAFNSALHVLIYYYAMLSCPLRQQSPC